MVAVISYGATPQKAVEMNRRRTARAGALAVIALAVVVAAVALTQGRSVELYEYHVPGTPLLPRRTSLSLSLCSIMLHRNARGGGRL